MSHMPDLSYFRYQMRETKDYLEYLKTHKHDYLQEIITGAAYKVLPVKLHPRLAMALLIAANKTNEKLKAAEKLLAANAENESIKFQYNHCSNKLATLLAAGTLAVIARNDELHAGSIQLAKLSIAWNEAKLSGL